MESRLCSKKEWKSRVHIHNFCHISLYYIVVFSVAYPYVRILITSDLKKSFMAVASCSVAKKGLDSLLPSSRQEQRCFSHSELKLASIK